jgi:hypothetical protein
LLAPAQGPDRLGPSGTGIERFGLHLTGELPLAFGWMERGRWTRRRPRSTDYERQWVVDMLRHLGQGKAADDAARELPERVSRKELEKFAERHGLLSHDELISLMGGSP